MIRINIEHILVHTSLFSLSISAIFYWGNLLCRNKNLRSLGKISFAIALACTTISLMIRWFHLKHLPLSNSYESLMFLSWSVSLLNILLGHRDENVWVGAIIAPSAMLTQGFATLGLPEEMQTSTLLVPALQSHWLMMHVSMMLLSYATILCGSLSAITLLLVITYDPSANPSSPKNLCISYLLPGNKKYSYMRIADSFNNFFYLVSMNHRREIFIQKLDHWSHRIISLGFPLLTIGISSGAVWANEAWGSYWSWDPKETWAFITWLIYAIYSHTRVTRGWRGEKSATVAVSGFLSIWICYLGVNLLGVGLHSYGWLI
uniref:Cytochrome c biogenesis protein CcsA n=2 Tax=Ophioglossum TaxID=13833 RepID=L7SZM4_9MONI|nr:cytochrome c biogenesis protein ccsA [Ophioglossum californicum]AGC26758.1 cytochrome c biogenesis protein ccsA [Ophioglossum californicum]QXF60131.1 cytochrome c biogenesis protein [Ophioglossum vulgatum]